MKFAVRHRFHQSSPPFDTLIRKQIEEICESLHIDEARVLVERRPEGSPPFRIAAHLVTPGPDISVEAIDHTPSAALRKMIDQIRLSIEHRTFKRASRRQRHDKTAPHMFPAAAIARI